MKKELLSANVPRMHADNALMRAHVIYKPLCHFYTFPINKRTSETGLMTLYIDELSIWEIAHRWHNADPSHSETVKDIPLEVKDTLRNLATEVYHEELYSTLLLEREAERGILKPYFKRNFPFFWKKTWYFVPVSHYTKEFEAVINNDIDPTFLKSIMIPHWELEYWCRENQIPFPDFWRRSITMEGNEAPSPYFAEFSIDEDNTTIDGEKTKSESHQRAAYSRHEPANALKREFIQFAEGRDGSLNKLAGQFYKSLPEEKKKKLIPSNAERTLSQALSKYRRGIKEQWMEGLDIEK